MYHESCIFTMSFQGILVLSLRRGLWHQCLHEYLSYTSASAACVSAGPRPPKSLIVADMLPHSSPLTTLVTPFFTVLFLA